MAEFPALPLWTDAYLADTSHLSYEEHGLYLNLLLTMWRTPGCQIPSDPKWLEKRFKNYANAMRSLCDEFCHLSDDGKYWHQKKLRKVWKWCQQKREKASESSNARWNNEKTPSERISVRNANAMRSHRPSNASKSKSQSSLEGVNGFLKEGRKDGFKAEPTSPEFIAWKKWAFEKNTPLWREIVKREQEGRGFDFESHWPPDHKGVAA